MSMHRSPAPQPTARQFKYGWLVALVVAGAGVAWFAGSDETVPPVPAVAPVAQATRPVAPAGARSLDSPQVVVDAQGRRILNEAGLPSGPPLPSAAPLPIKAAPGEVIGFSKDAQGAVRPLRAGELKQVPNSPGTYAVVDMWADGGYAVVPASKPQGQYSESELALMRKEEAARDARNR